MEESPKTENSDFLEQVRHSVDMIREYYPQDARKRTELPQNADYRPSMEMRRAPLGQIPLNVPKEELPRKSLEQALDEKDDDDVLKNFPLSEGLTTSQAEELLVKYGRNELPEKVTPKWLLFCSLLWQPMPCMIWIAGIVELIIQNWIDAAILFCINLVNASLSFYESTKAKCRCCT